MVRLYTRGTVRPARFRSSVLMLRPPQLLRADLLRKQAPSRYCQQKGVEIRTYLRGPKPGSAVLFAHHFCFKILRNSPLEPTFFRFASSGSSRENLLIPSASNVQLLTGGGMRCLQWRFTEPLTLLG